MPAALGIDLGGTKIEALRLDAQGRETWRCRRATPAGYEATLDALAALVEQARRPPRGPGRLDLTVGLGTPGTQTAEGLMKNCNSTWLNGRTLLRDLQERLRQPLALANDANCLALSEATDGAGAGAGVVFAAILGTGVGAGITVDGRLHAGPNGVAGEWGHNPLPWSDPALDPSPGCYCGKRGCIETLISGPALALDHRAVSGEDLDAATLCRRAAAGDSEARATLDRHASRLARALSSVINLMDPDVVVLGGGVSRMPHLYTQVPALWGRWVAAGGQSDPVRTPLRPALHGDASGVRGAAWLGRQATSA